MNKNVEKTTLMIFNIMKRDDMIKYNHINIMKCNDMDWIIMNNHKKNKNT